MLPPETEPLEPGHDIPIEILIRLEDKLDNLSSRVTLLSNRVTALARLGIAVGASSGSRVGMRMGVTPTQKGQMTRQARKFVMAGSVKAVWSRTSMNCYPDMALNFPIPLKQLVCVVECVGDTVDSKTRSELSTTCVAFTDDIENVYDSPDACMEQVCTQQVLLTAMGKLVELVRQGLYIALPETFTSVIVHYDGICKSTDLDDPHPYSIVTTMVVPTDIKVENYICESMNVLTNAERKKVLEWAITVKSATDVRVGAATIRAHRRPGNKGVLQMVDGSSYAYHNGQQYAINVGPQGVGSGAGLPPGSVAPGRGLPATGMSSGASGTEGGSGTDIDDSPVVSRRRRG